MKTVELVIGLFQVLGAVCGFASVPILISLPVVAVLVGLAGVVNMVVGINRVMDALFGDGGLICEVFPVGEDD